MTGRFEGRTALVTGGGSGIGEATCRLFAREGAAVTVLDRDGDAAARVASDIGGRPVTCDVRDADGVNAAVLDAASAMGGLTDLINNAGLIPAIAPVGDIAAADLARAMRVDLEAPMLLTGAFLRATAGWAVPRKVLNISSGLGRRAMASQAAYCAAKAGMDHFTRSVALEEALAPNGAKVCSLAPGVIDTDMQVQLRSADSAAFPDIGNFIGMKEKGQLSSPQDAAAKVLGFLNRPDFGANPVADVRDQ